MSSSFLESLRALVIGFLAATVLRLLSFSWRWKLVGFTQPQVEEILADSLVIFTFWHEQQVAMPLAVCKFTPNRAKKIMALISQHGDGRIAAETIKYFRLGSVAGSSTRGGHAAIQELLKSLANGSHAAITPDGPRGPRRVAKTGIVSLAQHSGALILPVAIGTSKAWTMRSWDQMFIPKPGARVVVAVGEPIRILRELDEQAFEAALILVQERLNEISAQAAESAAST